MINTTSPRVFMRWDSLELVIKSKEHQEYAIDLDRCRSSAALLDWLLQVKSKGWCDHALIGEILDVLESACERRFNDTLQGVYCPCESPHWVDWEKGRYGAQKVTNLPAVKRTEPRS